LLSKSLLTFTCEFPFFEGKKVRPLEMPFVMDFKFLKSGN
jgi:hypothetical protein